MWVCIYVCDRVHTKLFFDQYFFQTELTGLSKKTPFFFYVLYIYICIYIYIYIFIYIYIYIYIYLLSLQPLLQCRHLSRVPLEGNETLEVVRKKFIPSGRGGDYEPIGHQMSYKK